MLKNIKPYRARNMFVRKLETPDNLGNENIEYGFLEISVYHNVINEPIENAEVRVSLLTISGLYQERGEGRLITTVKTDVNGYAPRLRLPALNRLQQTENENVNRLYVLAVEAEEYYNAYDFNIQIYPNITTSYKIYLRHIVEDKDPRSHYEFFIEPNVTEHL